MIFVNLINMLLCIVSVIIMIVDMAKGTHSVSRACSLFVIYTALCVTDTILGNYLFGLCWLVLSGLWLSIYWGMKIQKRKAKELYDQYVNKK